MLTLRGCRDAAEAAPARVDRGARLDDHLAVGALEEGGACIEHAAHAKRHALTEREVELAHSKVAATLARPVRGAD